MSESFDAGPDTDHRPMTREDHIRTAALEMAIRSHGEGVSAQTGSVVERAGAFAAFLRGAA